MTSDGNIVVADSGNHCYKVSAARKPTMSKKKSGDQSRDQAYHWITVYQVYKYQHHLDTAESTTADGSIGKDNCSEDQEDKEEKEKEPREEEAGDVLNEQLSEEALSANQENNLSEVEHAPNDIS